MVGVEEKRVVGTRAAFDANHVEWGKCGHTFDPHFPGALVQWRIRVGVHEDHQWVVTRAKTVLVIGDDLYSSPPTRLYMALFSESGPQTVGQDEDLKRRSV